MLAILERRMQNEPAAEILEAAEQQRLITACAYRLLEAAEQQRRITRLRLDKLLNE